MQTRIVGLLAILVFVVIYSVVSLYSTDNPVQTQNLRSDTSLTAHRSSPRTMHTDNDSINKRSLFFGNDTVNSSSKKLPFEFSVIGISERKLEDEQFSGSEAKVLIRFDNEIYEHSLNDFLLNSTMQLVKIEPKQISVIFQDDIYTKPLTPPNLLASDFKKKEKTYAEFIKMTANEISTRPRILEHLVGLTSTPYIADGMLVSPGLNPLLFTQAGFKDDDVLQTINGKSVTIDAELEEIKENLKSAHTLKFVVMRKGRIRTLYLDIPSEGLELVRD